MTEAGSIEATVRFSIVPEAVSDYTVLGLSANAVRLYAILDRYGNSEGAIACPSRRTLSNRCGFSADTVDRAKAELVAAGVLEVIPRRSETGAQTSNEHRLHRTPAASTEEPLGTSAEGGSRIGAEGPLGIGAAQQRASTTESSASPTESRTAGVTGAGQNFVGFFVDEARRVTGNDPLPQAKARLGRDAAKLAEQGVSEATIRAAITELVENGMHVGAFIGLADQAHRGGYRRGRRRGLGAKDLLATARELEAAGR